MLQRTVLIVLILFAAFGLAAEPMDMIVLLDVSQSMFPYFDDTINFLLKDIIDGHLQTGDGFHLLSFAGSPEREIHRVITTERDMEAVLARIMLLHPLGRHTDFLFALDYLYDYVSRLPLRSSKNILILTDGIHDPPSGTSYPAGTAGQRESNREEVISIATEMKREGWQVRLVQFPRGPAPGSSQEGTGMATGGSTSVASSPADDAAAPDSDSPSGSSADTEPDLYATISEALGVDIIEYENGREMSHTATGAPHLEFPDNLGTVGRNFTVPFKIINYVDTSILVKLDQIRTRGVNILDTPAQLKLGGKGSGTLNARITLPESFEQGEYQLDVELLFSDDLRIYPRKGDLFFELKNPVNTSWIKIVLLIVIGLGLLYFLIFFIIIPLSRHIEHSAGADTRYVGLQDGRGTAKGGKAALTHPDSHAAGTQGKVPLLEAASYSPGGKIPLSQISSTHAYIDQQQKLGHRPIEFRLSGQNPYNGGRNIRWVGKNKRSVGGAGAYFLIFLIKVPERIAEVTFTEEGLRFTPIRTEFFPSLQGPIENCLNRPIEIQTDQGSFTMFFREWISPLERINHLLHLIDQPGTAPEDLY
ncbi:VWA domain-containing protein [Marispirochaeta sp.]|uniref:vWA domain-containing protein n=1 Tax=Marispirochaeta sp. TaxID=2038653 RepID=UPI0029C6AF40|nr:VWA domain-containing protein [Marispirochaeta sp.]